MTGQRACLWFQWIGGYRCDQCGGTPADHDGLEWARPGTPMSLYSPDRIRVRWADYGPGRTLNVPMLTNTFGRGIPGRDDDTEEPMTTGHAAARLGMATTRELITELEARAAVPQNPEYDGGAPWRWARATSGPARTAHYACAILRGHFAGSPGGLDYRTADG